jgi:hypothetical protein
MGQGRCDRVGDQDDNPKSKYRTKATQDETINLIDHSEGDRWQVQIG